MASLSEYQHVKYRAIFHDILDNKSLSPQDKAVDRLWQEAQIVMSTGTATTAMAISSALVYLLPDPQRLQILLEELETVIPDVAKPKSHAELERLPYLVHTHLLILFAQLHEGLRLLYICC
jgi:hypothetical protein